MSLERFAMVWGALIGVVLSVLWVAAVIEPERSRATRALVAWVERCRPGWLPISLRNLTRVYATICLLMTLCAIVAVMWVPEK
jgi:hypothetical protein